MNHLVVDVVGAQAAERRNHVEESFERISAIHGIKIQSFRHCVRDAIRWEGVGALRFHVSFAILLLVSQAEHDARVPVAVGLASKRTKFREIPKP